MIGPDKVLPISDDFSSAEEYVASLQDFVTTSSILQTLCGGVHVLDFFTCTPDIYQTVLPLEWTQWFEQHGIDDILDLLLRVDLTTFSCPSGPQQSWRTGTAPPASLLSYIRRVRRHTLDTAFTASTTASTCACVPTKMKNGKYTPSRQAMVAGMNPKKLHEVSHFAQFLSNLSDRIMEHDVIYSSVYKTEYAGISHFVDFGSGQNYLGRTLASPPYCRDIVAIESRPHVVQAAKRMDVRASLVERALVMRNKKDFKLQGGWKGVKVRVDVSQHAESCARESAPSMHPVDEKMPVRLSTTLAQGKMRGCADTARAEQPACSNQSTTQPDLGQEKSNGSGSLLYIQDRIIDGNLSSVIQSIPAASLPLSLMVISLHSCGNLVHHGLRTLEHNPQVRAVAMVGCCYNLMTERFDQASFKLPVLRSMAQRLEEAQSRRDPHGFPMSAQFATYVHKPTQPIDCIDSCTPETSMYARDDIHARLSADPEHDRVGIRINITARMMAVQAPLNWTSASSDAFFTRHFYRAVLQRIFMDRGVVKSPGAAHGANDGRNLAGTRDNCKNGTAPVIIGRLSPACYKNFVTYTRGAIEKLQHLTFPADSGNPNSGATLLDDDNNMSKNDSGSSSKDTTDTHTGHVRAQDLAILVRERIGSMTDHEIQEYETRYLPRRKHLCVIWSLMAFSAQVIEACIVTDRWLWLTEQEFVAEAWVQAVFAYDKSPRNMVVVGIRKIPRPGQISQREQEEDMI